MTTEAEEKEANLDEFKRRGTKLVLWCTRNFKPLITHYDLEPIMATIGFVPVPLSPNPTTTNFDKVTVVWKEYKYSAASAITTRPGAFRNRPRLTLKTPPPTPRLPYPRIDGLHIFTYRAFTQAVNFHLNKKFINDLFHVRGLPVHPIHDRRRSWFFMISTNCNVVYRVGTLDHALFNLSSMDTAADTSGERFIEEEDYEDDDKNITMVSIDDIIVTDMKNNSSRSQIMKS